MTVKKYFSSRYNTFMPNNFKNDVLKSEDSKTLRKHDLKRAVILGSTYNQESKLEYIDHTGRIRMVISKVIGLSEENAILNNDRIIPITQISKVVV